MFELIKLEWTKLCRRRITIIVTLCCFAGTIVFFLLPFLQFKAWDENGTMLAGKEAVSYRHEVYDKILSGLLTEERITGDIKEYQEIYSDPNNLIRERGGELSLKDELYYQYLEPRRSYFNMIGSAYSNTNEPGTANILNVPLDNGAQFYKERQKTIVERINNNEELNNAEKNYWKQKALSANTPFEYGYALGWANFGSAAEMLIICILGICIVISPVFSDEYRAGTAPIILSTRYGKNKVICAKIISALFFSSIVFLINAFVALMIPLLTFGADGGNLPIQIASIISPYNLTFKEASLLCILIAYLVLLGMASITLFLSSKMKSPFSVLIVVLLVIIVPLFFPLSKGTALLPSLATQGTSLFDYYISFGFGGIVINQILMIAIVYIAISALSIPLAVRNFRRHAPV